MHLAVVSQHASQFWPTLTRIGTLIAAVGGAIGSILAGLNHQRITQVHATVNGQFAAKVQQLADTAIALKQATDAGEAARHDLAAIGRRDSDSTPPPVI